MPERPLLLFPTPATAERAKLGAGFARISKPTAVRQWEKFSPKFQQLQQMFAAQRVAIQQDAVGIEPEQVLVIETIGSVQDFANAVKKIEGFEWMGEMVGDDVSPNEEFYNEENIDKNLSTQLYMIMSNQSALDQMLSLWKKYKYDSQFKFSHGLGKFKEVFLCLNDIRRWGIQERLFETGLLEVWKESILNDPSRSVRFEAELWFRGNVEDRNERSSRVTKLIQQMNGRVVSQAIIEDISYHAILGEIPADSVQSIIESPDIELTNCDSVMFFRPIGQMTIGTVPSQEETDTIVGANEIFPDGEPVIALLDGLPLSNHSLLKDRLRIDDPDGFEAAYTASERVHGTSMASLI